MNHSTQPLSKKTIASSSRFDKADAIKTASFEQLALGHHRSAQIVHGEKPSGYDKFFALPAYYWVLIAQVVIILPHAAHLPLWLMGFAVVSIIAQLPRVKARFRNTAHLKRVYQGMQMLGFLLGLAGLWLTYHTAFGLDMGVAFLVLCLISKL